MIGAAARKPLNRSPGCGRIAVTGASGFVGRALVERLVGGSPILALSRSAPPTSVHRACWVQSPELDARSTWAPLLTGVDVLIHCAARVHMASKGGAAELAEFRRVNCLGTLKLAEDAAATGVRRFVFISSIKVNGERTAPDRPFRYDDTPAPVDAYGISKCEAEQELLALGDRCGMGITIVRPPLVYGRGVRANFAALIRLVASGVPLPFGSVNNRRSLVYVGNLADLVATAATHPGAAGKILLASDGVDLSTAELVEKISHAMGKAPRLISVPPVLLQWAASLSGQRRLSKRLLESLAVDIYPTRQALSWAPPFGIEEALAHTLAPVD